jgi:hypothetical protein
MLMLPPLLIRVEDVDAWKTDEPWIGETYVHFANTVTNISDKAERIAVARRGRSRALGSFYQRAKERGWIVDSERRSIVKAG